MAVTANTIKTVIHSDFFTNLNKHPVKSDLVRKTNEDAIKQSVKNLLLTDRFERLFQPDVGGNINALLFENVTPQTELALKTQIYNTIEQYEPRAKLIDVIVSGNIDRNEYRVSIYFYVINSEEPVQLNLVLDRVR